MLVNFLCTYKYSFCLNSVVLGSIQPLTEMTPKVFPWKSSDSGL